MLNSHSISQGNYRAYVHIYKKQDHDRIERSKDERNENIDSATGEVKQFLSKKQNQGNVEAGGSGRAIPCRLACDRVVIVRLAISIIDVLVPRCR